MWYIQKPLKFLFSSNADFYKKIIMSYYAVAKGRKPGIYLTWDECKAQVHQFSGPIYKKFNSKSEAENFIKERSSASSNYSKTTYLKQNSLLATEKTYALGKNNRQTSSSSKRCLSTKSDSDDGENIIVKRKKYFQSNKSSDSKTVDGFIVDDDGYTEVFTDGACQSNGNKGHAKAGIGIWFSDNHELNISQPVDGRATNNMAEIQAVTIAARQAQKAGIKKLKISTDSQFLINCITKWMPKWKTCGWKTAAGKPVINKDELKEMEKALAPLEVRWNHVRGHVGIYGNEMADKLARDGSKGYENTTQK